jgi:hypothetical protein
MRPKPPAAPVFAYVVWDDAQMTGHWLDAAPDPHADLSVYTVGWLLHESKDRLVMVQSIHSGGCGNEIQIPRGMVRELVKVELA